MKTPLLTSALLFASTAAVGQAVPSRMPDAVRTNSADASAGSVLRAGTPIALTMAEALTTRGKKLRPGYRFLLEVAEAVNLQGKVVIPAGSFATGEVTNIRNKGMWGKSGHINARILYVRVGDRQVRLTGQVSDKGKTGTAAVVGSIVLIPIAGFFATGTSAHIPIGARVTGYLDEDITAASSATLQKS